MAVRWEAGQVVPASPWIEYGDFSSTGPCNKDERLVFDHIGSGDGLFRRSHNPYWANDFRTLVDDRYNGATASSIAIGWLWYPREGSQRCFVLIFTTEEYDAECRNVHADSRIEGVLLDYGVLSAGAFSSSICLNSIGGLPLPATPSDDGNEGTKLLGGWEVFYLQAPPFGGLVLASGAEPLLGYIRDIGSSTPTQWDDNNPTNGEHTSDECYQYPVDDSGVLGGVLQVWVSVDECVPNGGDVDGNGCVNDLDLLAVLFAFGNTGGAEDTNCDGTVNDSDVLELLFSFGSGC